MGWAETAREERRAPIGEHEPERYKVVVYDTFEQDKLRAAAVTIRNGMTVPEFFLYCAEYVLRNHRKLATVRKVYGRSARAIVAAVKGGMSRREAVESICGRAWGEIVEPIRSRELTR